MKTFIVTGTDTNIGKTVYAASLMLKLEADYWKPIQCGREEGLTDTDRMKQMTGLPDNRFIPEIYVLEKPLSPHRAAEIDGVKIDVSKLTLPKTDRTLIVEGAGGLMVPITRDFLMIDLFQQWNQPVILCARTGLGTLNHTLLSIEALKKRNIPIHGVAFIGDENKDNRRTICEMGDVKDLGRLPVLESFSPETLQSIHQE